MLYMTALEWAPRGVFENSQLRLPDHERSDGAFTAIVADLQPAIFQERR